MTPAERRAKALNTLRTIKLSPADHDELATAGERRKAAMQKVGVATYRSLLAHENGGRERVERRP